MPRKPGKRGNRKKKRVPWSKGKSRALWYKKNVSENIEESEDNPNEKADKITDLETKKKINEQERLKSAETRAKNALEKEKHKKASEEENKSPQILGKRRRPVIDYKKAATGIPKRLSGKPKRPRSAFFIFFAEHRPQVRKDLEKNNEGVKVRVGDMARKLADMWKAVEADEKAKFQKLADAEKSKYQDAMDAYNAKHGSLLVKIEMSDNEEQNYEEIKIEVNEDNEIKEEVGEDFNDVKVELLEE
ncbi:unnamed protein product [Oikopleura dioica]|uniref:HMG box domain-containing protein n=1 Tax=Oikopleura dioica TaxID=34765 RepID=E4XHG9_OIKDI|nr:unnamed protein product [Oikopleura dioica]